MASTLGRIEEFDGSKDDWPQYVEQLEHFFVANGITTPEKKRALFLSVVGAAMYKTLHNLVPPDKPGDKTYRELVSALTYGAPFVSKPKTVLSPTFPGSVCYNIVDVYYTPSIFSLNYPKHNQETNGAP